MLISIGTSRSGRSRGSSTASGLEGASRCIRRFTLAARVECIFSVKLTGVQPVALCPGVLVFVLFQMKIFKCIFELLILEFSFCVSNDGRRLVV